MIIETVTRRWRNCQSENIVKNGHNAYGKQQYRCKACGACKVLEPILRYSEERKEEILRAYQKRPNLGGIVRLFGVSRPTLSTWLKKLRHLPEVEGRPGRNLP
jgi:transposase-like protein